MRILIIELIWVAKYGKMGEKPPFQGNFGGWYRYQIEWYRYRIFGTDTQCSIMDQCSYCGHNLVISYPISMIQVAG